VLLNERGVPLRAVLERLDARHAQPPAQEAER